MIERQLAVIPYKNHLLSAVFQGNELYDIIVEPAEAEQTIATGDIYLAKVKNVVPNMPVSFIQHTCLIHKSISLFVFLYVLT